MIALTIYHTHGAVHHHRLPTFDIGQALCVGTLIPIGMRFNVRFIHAIDAVVVKHRIHLGLTGVVAATNRVHIRLTH